MYFWGEWLLEQPDEGDIKVLTQFLSTHRQDGAISYYAP